MGIGGAFVSLMLACGWFDTFGGVQPTVYGPDPAYSPTYDVDVRDGALNQALLDAYPEGTRFLLEAGTYRLSSPLAPRARQQILGMPGAVISGSKLLSGWKQEGNRWYVEGQTQRLAGSSGEVVGGNPMAGKSEDVFYDDKPLQQVDSLVGLTKGKFYFDYANSRIYLADQPTGHKVETTVMAQAIKGGGAGVVLQNLVVEKFGNAAQVPAITNDSRTGWLVENCEIRFNHGWGLQIGDGGTVRGCNIHHQGQLGIGGGGANVLVENNEIAYNNSEGFNSFWEAGGSKWVYANGLTVRKNWVHHNYGPGLWTDIENRNVVYEDNLVEANDRMGIVHEISGNAIIRRNTVRGNGVHFATWEPDGAGIVVSNSSGVEVVDNTVEDNVAGIVIVHATDRNRDTRDNYVHGNTIQMRKGYSGLVLAGPPSSAADAVFTSNHNRFADNRYYLPFLAEARWSWRGGMRSFDQWQALGNDLAGGISLAPAP
ncbi:MAG TPA: right-handed parallel beta-helix repeat-containing protein [Stenomitos sp.]